MVLGVSRRMVCLGASLPKPTVARVMMMVLAGLCRWSRWLEEQLSVEAIEDTFDANIMTVESDCR